jgi:cytochrome c oxidase assembly factor CtaG
MTTRELLLSAWDFGPAAIGVSLASLAAYAARFRRTAGPRAGFFVLAVLVFFLALASPVGTLARGYLFSAHMLQHLLLVLAVPPLVLVGLPRPDGDEASPREWTLRACALPWLSGVGAMWIWHARVLCNAAAVSPAVQWLQTASLVAMGLAFWRPILAPRTSERLQPLLGVLYLFAACVACSILGILVTFSPVEVCPAYMHPVDTLGVLPLLREGWGMNCKVDQEVGGLLMWVPGCFVYAGSILATLGRYYGEEHRARASGGARS